MYSKVKIAGHPVHPMLISFPVALYTIAFVCYCAYQSNINVVWFKVAVGANAVGVIMAIVAALPGFIDWLNIPKEKKAKRTGLLHMLCHLGALVLFGINVLIQYPKLDDMQPNSIPSVFLSGIGMVLTLAGGFLGWTLVQKHHMGVDLTPEQKRYEP